MRSPSVRALAKSTRKIEHNGRRRNGNRTSPAAGARIKHPDFHGEIIKELEKLRESDTVRVIDALAVYKDADGEIDVVHLSNLTKEEAIEFGSKVAALIGLGIDGEEGSTSARNSVPKSGPRRASMLLRRPRVGRA